MEKRGKTALVLAGGGSRGAYQIGVWQALLELDIDIDLITGTSVGALNGAMIAQGAFDDAVAVWREIETANVLDIKIDESLPVRRKALFTIRQFFRHGLDKDRIGLSTTPLKALLERYIDEERVRASDIELGFMTVDLAQRKPKEVFLPDIKPGSLIDYIMASAACYPAMQAQDIDGVKYVDGGYADNLPVEMAKSHGATFLIAVDLEALGIVHHKKRIREAQDILYLHSYWNLGPTLVFDKTQARRNLRLGYLDTMKAFGAFDGVAYTFLKGQMPPAGTDERLRALLEVEEAGVAARMTQKLLALHVDGKYQKRYALPGDLAQVCREAAGEVFGLNPEVIYSAPKFDQRLLDAARRVPLPAALKGGEKASLSPEKIKEMLSVFDKAVRAVWMADWMQSPAPKKEAILLPLLGLMPDEALAAAYLCARGNGEKLR